MERKCHPGCIMRRPKEVYNRDDFEYCSSSSEPELEHSPLVLKDDPIVMWTIDVQAARANDDVTGVEELLDRTLSTVPLLPSPDPDEPEVDKADIKAGLQRSIKTLAAFHGFEDVEPAALDSLTWSVANYLEGLCRELKYNAMLREDKQGPIELRKNAFEYTLCQWKYMLKPPRGTDALRLYYDRSIRETAARTERNARRWIEWRKAGAEGDFEEEKEAKVEAVEANDGDGYEDDEEVGDGVTSPFDSDDDDEDEEEEEGEEEEEEEEEDVEEDEDCIKLRLVEEKGWFMKGDYSRSVIDPRSDDDDSDADGFIDRLDTTVDQKREDDYVEDEEEEEELNEDDLMLSADLAFSREELLMMARFQHDPKTYGLPHQQRVALAEERIYMMREMRQMAHQHGGIVEDGAEDDTTEEGEEYESGDDFEQENILPQRRIVVPRRRLMKAPEKKAPDDYDNEEEEEYDGDDDDDEGDEEPSSPPPILQPYARAADASPESLEGEDIDMNGNMDDMSDQRNTPDLQDMDYGVSEDEEEDSDGRGGSALLMNYQQVQNDQYGNDEEDIMDDYYEE